MSFYFAVSTKKLILLTEIPVRDYSKRANKQNKSKIYLQYHPSLVWEKKDLFFLSFGWTNPLKYSNILLSVLSFVVSLVILSLG